MAPANASKGLRLEKSVYAGSSDSLKSNMGVAIDRTGGCGDAGPASASVVAGVLSLFIHLSCFEYPGHWMPSLLHREQAGLASSHLSCQSLAGGSRLEYE